MFDDGCMPLAPHLEDLNAWGHSRARVEVRKSLKDGAVPDAQAESLETQWINSLLFGAGSAAGIAVTPAKAMGVATVYACVSVLARSVASLPLHVYERMPDGSRELAVDHPLYDLLHSSPNDDMTSLDCRMAMQANLSLRQNAYAVIGRARGSDRVIDITPVENHEVEPMRDRATGQLFYKVKGDALFANEVLHLKGLSFNGLVAPDMIGEVRDVLGLALALDRNAASFFKNGSFPGGFLSHPGKLSKEAAERMRVSFEDQTGGANSYRLKVLEEGLQYIQGRMANKDAQMDESRERQAKEIARIFGVQGHKVGIVDNQPRANVEQDNISFVVDTLRPLLINWEQAMNAKLLSRAHRRRFYVEFNIAGLLRGDAKARFETYDIGIRNGIFNPNECRRMENMNPRDGGDAFLQPMNMTTNAQPTLTDATD